MDVEAIEQHVTDQKSGQLDFRLKQFGWSCDFADRTTNGGCFPSCYKCRKKTVDWLRDPQYGQQDEEICVLCGDWELNCTTKEKLSFPAPKNYPQRALPNCPVEPPVDREVGLNTLQYINFDFATMIQATRFAFFKLVLQTWYRMDKSYLQGIFKVLWNKRQEPRFYL
jgi:hypothetical protein